MSLLYSRRAAPWLLLAPVLVLGTIFYGVPIAFSFAMSLTDWNALGSVHWLGLANYVRLLTAEPLFVQSLVQTFVLALGSALIGIPAGLALALAVTAGRYRAIWRTIFWLPAITNIVAVAYAWQYVLDPTYGILNRLLALFGIAGPAWLNQPFMAVISVATVMAWLTLGHNMLLFSTGLEAIDVAVIEAARSDGATATQIFWHITLPLLRPTTLFVLVSTLISGMGSFALILVLTEGGPDDSTMVTALFMYRTAFESLRMGRASAIAVLLTLITLMLSFIQLRLFGRDIEAPA